MKILHIINDLSAGGAELHLLTLCEAMLERDVEVTVACLRDIQEESRNLRRDFDSRGIPVAYLGGNSRYSVAFLYWMARLISRDQPDLVHTHLPRADLYGLVRGLHPQTPWISSVHSVYATNQTWSGHRLLPVVAALWRRADAVIAISNAVSSWLTADLSVPPNRVSVIHYGIRFDLYAAKPAKTIETSIKRPVVGSVGRIAPGKGHEYLIEAIAELKTGFPNIVLRIAGHDVAHYKQVLIDLVRQLRVEENVEFLGFVSDVAGFLASIDVFALASQSEGFGQAVIEAMASGVPIVVSDIPPFAEILGGQEIGLAVPPNGRAIARALSRVLSDPVFAERMVMGARERVETSFSADAMTSRTIDLYLQTLGSAS